jgi:hypothetical protein
LRITRIPDPIDLSDAAAKLRSSSNFRFAWQFHQIDDVDTFDADVCRSLLDHVVADPTLNEFLRSTIDDIYPRDFEIWSLHLHCQIRECTDEFIDTFARGVYDHLGAYSRDLRESTADERGYVRRTFSPLGDFLAYSIFPGNHPDCADCNQYNHQLFSNWYFDVAWDYTYFVAWPDSRIVWLGCFSDTD